MMRDTWKTSSDYLADIHSEKLASSVFFLLFFADTEHHCAIIYPAGSARLFCQEAGRVIYFHSMAYGQPLR